VTYIDDEEGDMASRYAVCDKCGFFLGDLLLYPAQLCVCDKCGAERLWVFPSIDKALQHSRDIKGRA
jgi:hypothetical protein